MIDRYLPGRARTTCSLLFALFAVWTTASSQLIQDTILIERGRYYYHDVSLTASQVMKLVRGNPAAFREMRKANLYYAGTFIFATAGGAAIGASIGLAISGGDPEWGKGLGWGAGFIGISFLLQRGFKKHAADAVQLYNYGLTERQRGLSFQLSGGGIGLRYQF